MELIAFILAIAAIWCFFTKPIQYGLAVLTAAWIVQLILEWVTIHLEVGAK